jgi:hypothetical protein
MSLPLALHGPGPQPAPAVARITRHTEPLPLSYAALREQGIALAQAASGEHWTDYNLHDPGVTLLEALCFALTEGLFGAEQSVADLLTAADGHLHGSQHALHLAPVALPCRPTTEQDYRAWVLDQVPQAIALRLEMPADKAGDRSGLWRMAVQPWPQDSTAPTPHAAPLAGRCAKAYWAQRNLCEDLLDTPQLLTPRLCSVAFEVTMQGARDAADIVTELVRACAEYIAAAPQRHYLNERLAQCTDAQGVDTGRVFDGPLPQRGWITPESLRREDTPSLFLSDLAQTLQQIDGVETVHAVSLHGTGIEPGEAVAWHGPDWALQLAWPSSAEDLARLRISRRGEPVALPTSVLRARLDDARQSYFGSVYTAAPRQAPRHTAEDPFAMPLGNAAQPAAYLSVLWNLPPLYQALGSEMLLRGQRANTADRAQFSAYLALLEQWLAHGQVQGEHLPALYALNATPQQSYWWHMLREADLPLMGHVYGDTPKQQSGADTVEAQVFQPADAVLERRSRVLDHLLALHGEVVKQNSLRAFGCYFNAADWAQHLYSLKHQFARRVIRHTRDRAAGIDYSRASLGARANTSLLQERISLLLGFAQHHSRSLMSELAQQQMSLDEGLDDESAHPAEAGDTHTLNFTNVGAGAWRGASQKGFRAALGRRLKPLAASAISPAMLRSAVHVSRYRYERHASSYKLWLGPDEQGRHWLLGQEPDLASLANLARHLHQFACQLQLGSEGLHLVEHILLRTGSDRAGLTQSKTSDSLFFRHQFTVVFPGWTARCADPAFQELAHETIALCSPAHLLFNVLWLSATDMAKFEALYTAWLDAKRTHCQTLLTATADAATRHAAAFNVHQCAQALTLWLWHRPELLAQRKQRKSP